MKKKKKKRKRKRKKDFKHKHITTKIDYSTPSKVILLRSFKMVQNKHNGAKFQIRLLSFPPKLPCHASNATLMPIMDENVLH